MTLSFAPERIETWPLAKLQPYAKNAKAHVATIRPELGIRYVSPEVVATN